MIRLGLCCIFRHEPIRFRQTTAKALAGVPRPTQLASLSAICRHNLQSLMAALEWADKQDVRAFRVLSPIFPRYTHPDVGYRLDDLPEAADLYRLGEAVRAFSRCNDIRLSLHPDQFNVLSSPHPQVVANTVTELEYQGLVAELIGADVINIHGGGVYGSKEQALSRLAANFDLLSERVRGRLSLENDDRSYTPAELLPLCRSLEVPLVYDVHHHRCLPDGMSVEQATDGCVESWRRLGREPYLHLSSPANGWQAGDVRPHADYIDVADFPDCWKDLTATVDVEAKAKELAVLKLRDDLSSAE